MIKTFGKIMLATNSKGKIKEFKELLSDVDDVEFVTLRDVFGDNMPEEPEETGSTFTANSYLKAKYYSELAKLPCLADDSGMCVYALDGFPGVISKRFCITKENPNPSDEEHNIEMIKLLHQKGLTESEAYYECALTLYNAEVHHYCTSNGRCYGTYKDIGSGSNGFSFDSYFYPVAYNNTKSFADLEDSEKNSISHRGRAVQYLKDNIKFKKTYICF